MSGRAKKKASPTPGSEPAGDPVPCWFCGAQVRQEPDGRLTDTDPANENPRRCPEHMAGHRTRLLVSWEDTPEMKAAWRAYDALARAMPQCEHVTAWQAETAAARLVYHKAMQARDKLWNAQAKADDERQQQIQDELARAEAEALAAESDDLPAGAVAEEPDPGQGG